MTKDAIDDEDFAASFKKSFCDEMKEYNKCLACEITGKLSWHIGELNILISKLKKDNDRLLKGIVK